MPSINDILSKIINKEIGFASLGSTCKEIKKIRSLKDEFIRLVGASLWEAAQESYPGYANKGILKRKFEGIRESPLPKTCQLWSLSAKRL